MGVDAPRARRPRIAAALPALRGARSDPMAALRED